MKTLAASLVTGLLATSCASAIATTDLDEPIVDAPQTPAPTIGKTIGTLDPTMGHDTPFLSYPVRPDVGHLAVIRSYKGTLSERDNCLIVTDMNGREGLVAMEDTRARWDTVRGVATLDGRVLPMGKQLGIMGDMGGPVDPATRSGAAARKLRDCGVEWTASIEDVFAPTEATVRNVTSVWHPALRRDRLAHDQLCTVEPYPAVASAFTYQNEAEGGIEIFYRDPVLSPSQSMSNRENLRCSDNRGGPKVCMTDGSLWPVLLRQGDGLRAVRPRSRERIGVRITADDVTCSPVGHPDRAYSRPYLWVHYTGPGPAGASLRRGWEASGRIDGSGCLMLDGADGVSRVAVFSSAAGWDDQSGIALPHGQIAGELSFNGVASRYTGWPTRLDELRADCGTADAFVLETLP